MNSNLNDLFTISHSNYVETVARDGEINKVACMHKVLLVDQIKKNKIFAPTRLNFRLRVHGIYMHKVFICATTRVVFTHACSRSTSSHAHERAHTLMLMLISTIKF